MIRRIYFRTFHALLIKIIYFLILLHIPSDFKLIFFYLQFIHNFYLLCVIDIKRKVIYNIFVSFETVLGGRMNYKDLFGSLFLFEGTDFSAIDEKYSVSDSVRESIYGKGENIICDGLPVICRGKAAIVSGEGEHFTVLRRLREGDTFGAATLFCRGEHRTRVTTEDGCVIAYIPREMLVRLIENEPLCSVNYISFLSGRIAFLNKKITAFTAGSSDGKLAVYLSGLPEYGSEVTVPVSLSELSNMLGIGRASLYRSFDVLSDAGIIEKAGKSIIILDREKLDNYNK